MEDMDEFDEEYGEPSTRKTPPPPPRRSSCCCCWGGRSSYDGFALRMLVCIGAALCLLTVGIAFGVRTVQHRAIQKPSYEDLVWNELPLAVQTGTCDCLHLPYHHRTPSQYHTLTPNTPAHYYCVVHARHFFLFFLYIS